MLDRLNYLFIWLFYILAFALPITEATKQLSIFFILVITIIFLVRRTIIIQYDALTISAIALVIISFISALLGVDSEASLKGSIDIFRIMVVFLILRHIHVNGITIKNFHLVLFIAALAAMIYGLFDIYQSDTFMHLELHSIGQVNHSSIYLLIIFTLALSWWLIKDQSLPPMPAYFLIFVLLMTIVGIYISGSRATMLASVLVIVWFLWAQKLYLKREFVLLIFVFVLIATLIILMNDYSMAKITGFTLDEPRKALYEATLLAWLDHNIWWGIGADNTNMINLHDYVNNRANITATDQHTHNTYLSYLLERGLLGLIAYLSFMLFLLFALVKAYRKDQTTLVVAALLIWFINSFISLVNTTFHNENALLMAIIWGLALNVYSKTVNDKT